MEIKPQSPLPSGSKADFTFLFKFAALALQTGKCSIALV